VEVNVTAEDEHFYGNEFESKIVERMAEYKVNGIPGSGITEWQYRNIQY
jgi:hypothetical protein